MKKLLLTTVACLLWVTMQAARYDVRDFGAAGDGKQLDSPAINRAIEEAAAHGGGTVCIPAGLYRCYSIRLKSRITLQLESGATLLAAEPTADEGFDAPEPPVDDRFQGFGHNHVHNALIWGVGLEDVTLCGPGLIDGTGLDSWTEGLPHHGNKALGLRDCRNVTVRDLTFYRGGHFALHLTGVNNLTVTDLRIDSDRDGLDIICCRNVRIAGCAVNTPQDDAIVLKSPYTLGEFRDVENVTISDCRISGYRCGTMLDGTRQRFTPEQDAFRSGGRIKLGTESSGGYRNIAVSNCTFDYCGGLMLQSMDGGDLEDVVISGIIMRDVLSAPIFIRLGARMRSPEGTPVGHIRRVSLSDISVHGADSWNACIISGIPGHRIEQVALRNIRIHYRGGFGAEAGKVIPPEFEQDYPEPWMFGTSPAKGFFIRHAEYIDFDGIRFRYLEPDGRPLFKEIDTQHCTFRDVAVEEPQPSNAATVDLDGVWQYGLDRRYEGTTLVPGIALDPKQITPGTLWYRREIELPGGSWNRAVLELKGARFRPEVYVDGRPVSRCEGGMIRSELPLSGCRPGARITLEIALQSLADVPVEDASRIPDVDQWRSNCSSGLWDDAVLHLYKDARIDRVLVYGDTGRKHARLVYRIEGSGARRARLTLSDSRAALVRLEGPACEGENEVGFDYAGLLEEWSPENPACYRLRAELLDDAGEVLSAHEQTVGLRTFAVRGKQFELNGEPIRLRGGSVVWHRWVRDENARTINYDTTWYRRNVVEQIKKRGGNYLRFHLGVPPERILDLCDRYGLAVQYEWSFFHGLPASYESLVEQYGKWLDLASRHPSVLLYHPYNETSEEELQRAWQALNKLCKDYPPIVLADRDVNHIHRYWWGMSENLGLYYDSYEQFRQPIVIDEFGGFYLDEKGDIGAYPMLASARKRWLGESDDLAGRLRHQCLATGKLGEYWRMLGAAGIGAFAIGSSFEDGNNWYMGDPAEGRLKPVWDAMTCAWSARSVPMEIWERNFTPGERVELPLHFLNDSSEGTEMRALVRIADTTGRYLRSDTVIMHVQPFARERQLLTLTMPETPGTYRLSSTLLDPPPGVERPVVSTWDIAILQARPSDRLKRASVYIPAQERELLDLARRTALDIASDPQQADLLLTGRYVWEHLDTFRTMLDEALKGGRSVVMLDVGEQFLGKQYQEGLSNLGRIVRPTQTSTEIIRTKIVAGLTLESAILPEGESHLHPAGENRTLWQGLAPERTQLWNGLRGGLIVPAADMHLQGLSQEAFLNQWTARGAAAEQIRRGPCYAYEHCGFYEFSDRPDDDRIRQGLKDKVRFLIEDMPALDLSLDKNSPVQVTDLHAGYGDNSDGRATEFIALATAGKDLVRTPVLKIRFGAGEGQLILSQLLTAGRLGGQCDTGRSHPARYDEAAVQFVLNMLAEALADRKDKQE